MATRATRLGKFSHTGRLCTLGSFLKIYRSRYVDENFGLFFLTYRLILTQHGLGYILGDFFTKTSGHTDGDYRRK
jgi:hypothetical protein